MKTKSTKKVTKKPAFVVDMTTAETYLEVMYETAQAKVRAGLPITQDEADIIEKMGFTTAIDIIEQVVDEQEKHTHYIEDDALAEKLLKEIKKAMKPKLPWYKRFWRWITFRK